MAISGSDPVNDLNHALFGIRPTPEGEKRSGEILSAAPSKAGDTVAFSQETQERETLVNQIRALPDIRVDQLSSIQKALASGQHQVDGERVASGVIRETVLNAVA